MVNPSGDVGTFAFEAPDGHSVPDGKRIEPVSGTLESHQRGVVFLTGDVDGVDSLPEGECSLVQTMWLPVTTPRVQNFLVEYRRRRAQWAALTTSAE